MSDKRDNEPKIMTRWVSRPQIMWWLVELKHMDKCLIRWSLMTLSRHHANMTVVVLEIHEKHVHDLNMKDHETYHTFRHVSL
ncbi:hypothetical protein MTR_1g019140 [Medicago truncatula]|uniref:Uncharacterized protein n=1 Tax=Medicago truncatula TaxID=3880 RepID=G7I2E1_MEDTR|nr:hypothetical protein MTR_1g019140 [Medicago truncatula]